jgi:signal transduction histidine kinase
VRNLPLSAVIMLSGHGDEMIATEAMKRGATDYLSKARLNAASIKRAITNALEKSALRRKIKQQQEELELFARLLVHDLRAPAASIQTFAVRIGEWLEEGDQKKALEYADWVNQTACRMNRLIDTLQKYTMADAKLELDEIDMNQIFNSALADMQQLIQAKGSNVTSETLPLVLGNAPQLIQLLENLIGNGIKYCDVPNACIHLSASVPAVSAGEHRRIQFSISDNGIGIPEVDCKRIFEPFFRAGNSCKRDGSGLGLATCKKIIERHGGTIWCESKPGEGTRFLFTLPAAPSAA